MRTEDRVVSSARTDTQPSVLAPRSFRPRALELTKRLVRHASFSRTEGEREFATRLAELLREIGGDALEVGLYAVPDDPWGRSVVWAFLPGVGPRTVVLMSHYDTVDTSDYGPFAPWALEPDALRARMREAADEFDPLTREHLESDDWLFGRGAADMKSGIAAHLAVLEALRERARAGRVLDGNVILLVTPDEECESAGILAAAELLRTLRRERGLELVGAINNDYHSPRFEGDERRAAYTGTVGKLLPSVYVRGVETHAGEPYEGCDADLLAAEIIRAVSMRADLADRLGDDIAAPPTILKASDFKDRYDVQVPFDAYLYINYLTFALSPSQVLGRVLGLAREALAEALGRLQLERAAWRERAGLPGGAPPWAPRVVSYADLLRAAEGRWGADVVGERLEAVNVGLLAGGVDARVRSARMVRELWDLSGLRGPAAVVYFSPPYYPHLANPEGSPLSAAVRTAAERHGVELRRYYPYMSDGSYLSAPPAQELEALTGNMPLWSPVPDPSRYHLPLHAVAELGVDVVNVGVWGLGAHKREERVHVPYSCGTVPAIILETVLRLLGPVDG